MLLWRAAGRFCARTCVVPGAPDAKTSIAAEAKRSERERLRAVDQIRHRNALGRAVRELDLARAETDGGDSGLDDQRCAVVPVVEPAELAVSACCSRRGQSGLDDRMVGGDFGRWHPADDPVDLRRVGCEPGISLCSPPDPLRELLLDA